MQADIEYSARERVKRHHPWAQVKERADLSSAFTKYLPGQAWSNAIVVSGPLASKLGILTSYENDIILGADLDSDGKVIRERAWLFDPGVEALATLSASGYTFEPVTAGSQEELTVIAERWITEQLMEAGASLDASIMLVGHVEHCPDLSAVGGLSFYLCGLDGKDKWTVAIPVHDSEQVRQAISDFRIAFPTVMASEPVEPTELMAMIGAEIE